ncbi:hypothetical protein A2U01_0115680, partial [Trifolium medium]|nr:hypothetical protein [Trifolium medium]
SGHLRKFLDDAAKGHIVLPKQERYPPKGKSVEENKGDKSRVAVNTIAGDLQEEAHPTPLEDVT